MSLLGDEEEDHPVVQNIVLLQDKPAEEEDNVIVEETLEEPVEESEVRQRAIHTSDWVVCSKKQSTK